METQNKMMWIWRISGWFKAFVQAVVGQHFHVTLTPRFAKNRCKSECIMSRFVRNIPAVGVCFLCCHRDHAGGKWKASLVALKSATSWTREASAYPTVTEGASTRRNRWVLIPVLHAGTHHMSERLHRFTPAATSALSSAWLTTHIALVDALLPSESRQWAGNELGQVCCGCVCCGRAWGGRDIRMWCGSVCVWRGRCGGTGEHLMAVVWWCEKMFF